MTTTINQFISQPVGFELDQIRREFDLVQEMYGDLLNEYVEYRASASETIDIWEVENERLRREAENWQGIAEERGEAAAELARKKLAVEDERRELMLSYNEVYDDREELRKRLRGLDGTNTILSNQVDYWRDVAAERLLDLNGVTRRPLEPRHAVVLGDYPIRTAAEVEIAARMRGDRG